MVLSHQTGVRFPVPLFRPFRPMSKILVVDDLPMILDLFHEVLDGMGHEVILAANGIEALRLLEDTTFDLIISDHLMPVMDGEEFLKKVREFDTEVPFVFLTGYKAMNLDRNSRESIQGFLAKPFKISELENMINNILGK